MSVYICVCMYVFVCMHVCMHEYVCICVCMHVYVYVCILFLLFCILMMDKIQWLTDRDQFPTDLTSSWPIHPWASLC